MDCQQKKEIFESDLCDIRDPEGYYAPIEDSERFTITKPIRPITQYYYFLSKWDEMVHRYTAARIFLAKCYTTDWSYWFRPINEKRTQQIVELTFKAELYEAALMNYNIIVDLSWTAIYVATEYAIYDSNMREAIITGKEIPNFPLIEEAYIILNKLERQVVSPNSETTPFRYLQKQNPQFVKVIKVLNKFCEEFLNGEIRELYNYIKHRGKPIYREIEKLRPSSCIITRGDQRVVSHRKDLQRSLGLEESIQKLLHFDNRKLFPYISELLKELNVAIPNLWRID